MAIETKEQVLEKILVGKRSQCPVCRQEMDLWEVPPISFSDGLGWGVPYLFVCFNDACPTYRQGWASLEERYGQKASCRNICYPGTENFECMPVFGQDGAKAQIITESALAEEDRIKEATKRGFSLLAGFYVTQSWFEVLKLLMDAAEPARVRHKAAEMMGDIGELEALEPLKNIKTGNQAVDNMIETAIDKIHGRYYTMECPYCAEVVKKRAIVCKHCGRDIVPA